MSMARCLRSGKRSVSTAKEWRVQSRENSPAAIGEVDPPEEGLANGRWQELVVRLKGQLIELDEQLLRELEDSLVG